MGAPTGGREDHAPAVSSFDARVEWNALRALHVAKYNIAIDFDVFNLFNSDTILGKQYDARLTGPTGFDQTLEIIGPRIARLGLRFTF